MTELEKAATYLAAADPHLAPVIAQAGPPTLAPTTDHYWKLVDAIISQQLSVKAAATIEKRFLDLFGGVVPQPHQIIDTPFEQLRAVGLSNAKANYVRDLAMHILSGELKVEKLPELSNQEITKELTAVKGIGEWTAHMFLIFALCRLDVLPVGDLGIKNGIKQLYGFEALPTADDIQSVAQKYHWHPYESIASWYVWRSLEVTPEL